MADLPRALEFEQGADLIPERHLGVDPVQLIEIDALESESREAPVARRPQMLGPPVLDPLARSGSLKSGLGRDDDIARIRVQRLRDQTLGDFRPVRVRGINECDAESHRAPEHRDRFGVVRGFAPYAGAGETHGAEAQAMDGPIAPNDEGAAVSGGALVTRYG